MSAGVRDDYEILTIDGMELAGSKEYYIYYGFYQEDMEFIQCIREHTQPLADLHEAVETMRFVERLNASLI